MSRLDAYRQKMLARKAAAAGCSVDELLARSQAQADRMRDIFDLVQSNAKQRQAIARHAANCGRSFTIH